MLKVSTRKWRMASDVCSLQASTLTQNVTGTVGSTGNANLLLVIQIFLSRNNKKILHKIHGKYLFSFILSSFISKIFGDIFEQKLVNKNVPKCLLAL